ncbi:BZ3500_MvSof-1268-A1-R1_Chr2-1g04304 [Microbotryum saponariae]|uniref:BZ3500_MvSof-1268-A1-R1_Chr2-1g04304 protein n=1 Tax=Microbotryum saponariae TaxID=289078 RepID=A0A2X0KAC0_9BASI|nr:BZ3500_MvSof-1268-A1-R1_Chr2-1g04304 [Microbotryum saponariae]SCZ91379.1 BZ3501_MvSof-1269-A2-R1_Chr2-1g03960 [Microbotryum saponariae]
MGTNDDELGPAWPERKRGPPRYGHKRRTSVPRSGSQRTRSERSFATEGKSVISNQIRLWSGIEKERLAIRFHFRVGPRVIVHHTTTLQRPHTTMSRLATTISQSFRRGLLARSTPATRFVSPATRPYSTSSESTETSEGERALKSKLQQALQGSTVQVQDVSGKSAGTGWSCSGGCGTFYAISIQHASFKGLSTIKQHRIVNDLLADEVKGMHGLQVGLFNRAVPEETDRLCAASA